jgi:protein-disulfide isomerase
MAMGKTDAPITIYEYASATCPHCANFHINEWPLIRKEYVETGKARFVFREFPLDQVALAAFMLARCASNNEPEKYHALLDTIFKTQREWAKNPREGLMKIMRMAGMDEKRFDACLKDEKLARAIMNGARNASRDFKVASTPTFFINGRKVEGRRSIEEFRKIIDEELKRAQQEKTKGQ